MLICVNLEKLINVLNRTNSLRRSWPLRASSLAIVKIYYFNRSKNYFIILAHHFTIHLTSHLLC